MFSEHLNLMQDEDEDVILEGSDLHQVLIDMGYTNFDSTPRVKMEYASLETDLSTTKNYQTINQSINDKISLIYQCIFQENRLRKKQLKIISEANILLDDHAATICEFLDELDQNSLYKKLLEWLPFIGSIVSSVFCTLIVKRRSIATGIAAFTMLGFSMYEKLKQLIEIRNLKYLLTLQNELHNFIKQSLKILRRTHGKKLIVTEIHEKNELIGSEKYNIILSLKELLIEIFENLSQIYYQEASKVLSILPDSLHLSCILTNIETENNQTDSDDRTYDEVKSLYYTFILVQSEMMFILANAYNGKVKNMFFRIQKSKLSEAIKNLIKPLAVYYFKISKIMQTYLLCETQPIRRVFRGIPSSKWQDAYIHLDLTSQRIQSAYKEIISILESIDIHSEKDEDNQQLVESITEKMNEAYKQIESARSFAEFTSLLIAKAQHKPVRKTEKENENENLFSTNEDSRTVVMIDKDPEIEDEVFEEYIKEEYLKPLYEHGNTSIVQEFKLDKLLKKNFMSELKEVLIEKQKSMSERELRALKRMYDRVQRDSCINKIELEKSTDTKKVSAPPPPLPSPPPPPPPPPTPPTLVNTIIAETEDENESKQEKIRIRTPVPLPRVKMLQPEEDMPYVQRFAISECTPNFRFPPFKVAEETFIGSGENSEEEDEKDADNDSASDDGVIDN